ncbi:hypothetical protein UY3_18280 [Chelonia mydas]|uniref:Uncharacterized protein n=1 Tax=Chelonia mydas TaxID=8469 RepID=M7AI18_CHEMY|nr:hypothetical protein UY3_18280 [Chelonia mydas]
MSQQLILLMTLNLAWKSDGGPETRKALQRHCDWSSVTSPGTNQKSMALHQYGDHNPDPSMEKRPNQRMSSTGRKGVFRGHQHGSPQLDSGVPDCSEVTSSQLMGKKAFTVRQRLAVYARSAGYSRPPDPADLPVPLHQHTREVSLLGCTLSSALQATGKGVRKALPCYPPAQTGPPVALIYTSGELGHGAPPAEWMGDDADHCGRRCDAGGHRSKQRTR